MRLGQTVYPHKYLRKIMVNGKMRYVYAPEGATTVRDVVKDAKPKQIMIAHGKPTQIFVDGSDFVVFGPENIVGRKLFINVGSRGRHFAVARDPLNPQAEGVYLYTEDQLQRAASRKAAKAAKAERAWELLDRDAHRMMGSLDPMIQDMGLVIWLNNHTAMRIGAHKDSASVDPKQRAAILNQARQEGWSTQAKLAALDSARKPTYGLMTLRVGDMNLSGANSTATFRFLGKGSKENFYSVKLPPAIYQHLVVKKMQQRPEEGLFHRELNYKRIWRHYQKYGISPHISRHIFAQQMLTQLMRDFEVTSGDTVNSATRRFENQLREKVSDVLNHSKNVTQKHYLTTTYQKALQEFRDGISQRIAENQRAMREADTPFSPVTKALAEAVLWLELGAGNTVI